MDQLGLTPRDLIPYIGSGEKVSEVLSGKRGITMSMARALHENLKIPAEILLQKADADFAAGVAPPNMPHPATGGARLV